MHKPSYLTEAWLPEVEELLDDKGVGLSVNDRFGFDDGNGSVCVWYCWLMSRFAPLGESRCRVWLYFIDDSLDTVWLDALGGGAGMCLGLPVEWCNKTEQHNQTLSQIRDDNMHYAVDHCIRFKHRQSWWKSIGCLSRYHYFPRAKKSYTKSAFVGFCFLLTLHSEITEIMIQFMTWQTLIFSI